MLTCFWSTITSGITYCCLSVVYLILRHYKQNDNSNLLAEWFQWNTGIFLQVNCYHLNDMSRKLTNTGIILTTKCWNYSTCFGPKPQKISWGNRSPCTPSNEAPVVLYVRRPVGMSLHTSNTYESPAHAPQGRTKAKFNG